MEKIACLPLGALASNCYVIPAGEKAIVIDPASSEEVMALLENEGLALGGIIITHGHYDHFAGAAALKERTGAPIYAPDLDSEMYSSSDKSWAWFMQGTEFRPITPDHLFSDGDKFSVCGTEFSVMTCSGHTAGSCLLFCEKWGVIFTGDVVFCGSVGRTDGYSGSSRSMQESVSRIAKIEGDYTLLCGHGEPTTLSAEKKNNPYFRGI